MTGCSDLERFSNECSKTKTKAKHKLLSLFDTQSKTALDNGTLSF